MTWVELDEDYLCLMIEEWRVDVAYHSPEMHSGSGEWRVLVHWPTGDRRHIGWYAQKRDAIEHAERFLKEHALSREIE